MNLEHIESLSDGQVLETDICIVGAGPAGLTLAREFSGSSLRVILLESGGTAPDALADSMNEIESIGAPRVMDQSLLRNRILGGTSATWSGRTAFFDDIDFEQRAWAPYSGWPVTADELRPYLPRTMSHLGIGLPDNTDVETVWRLLRDRRQRLKFDPKLLREYFWQYSRDEEEPLEPMRFGPRAIREKSRNIRCILNATVTHITTCAEGRVVEFLEIKARSGKTCLVKPLATVLCAGGIENARLLLASNRIVKTGVGNAYDVVGRFLMDHPRGAIGDFETTAHRAIHDRFGIYRATLDQGAYAFTYGARLSPDIQRGEGLLNSAVWVNEVRANDDPWMSVAAIMSRNGDTMHHLRNAASNIDVVIAGLKRRFIHHRGVTHKLKSLELHCIVEQRPDPASRITLADRVDALGMPISRIDWRVSEQESRTVKRLAQLFSQELSRLGLASPKFFDMAQSCSKAPLSLPDVAHPIGTTRMSFNPKTGVVDRNCAVHGVEGLYIAGSSVFPTAGHANPTQMIIVLSARLADHLKARLMRCAGAGDMAKIASGAN